MTVLDGDRSPQDVSGASAHPVGPVRLRRAAGVLAAIGATTALVGLVVLPWSEDPQATFLDLATRPEAVDVLLRPAVFLALAVALLVDRWWRAALAAAVVLSAGPTWLFPQLLDSAVSYPDDIGVGVGALAVGQGLACVAMVLGLAALVVSADELAEPDTEVGGRDDTEVVVALLAIGLVVYGWFQGRFELDLGGQTVTDFAVASWGWPDRVGWVARATWLVGLALPLALVARTLTAGGGPVARRQLWLGCVIGLAADVAIRLAAIGTSQPTGSFGPEIELAPAPTGLLVVVGATVLFLAAGWRASIAVQGPPPAPIPVAPAEDRT